MPGPVQPRVFGEDLEPGPDDEDHKNRLKKCCQPTHAGKPGRGRAGGADGAGVRGDEALHRRDVRRPCADRHRRDQQHEADRHQPQQVEPPAAPDAHPGGDPAALGHGSGPRGGGRRPRRGSVAIGSCDRIPGRPSTRTCSARRSRPSVHIQTQQGDADKPAGIGIFLDYPTIVGRRLLAAESTAARGAASGIEQARPLHRSCRGAP